MNEEGRKKKAIGAGDGPHDAHAYTPERAMKRVFVM